VYFFDSETGWIVGDWGNILHTNDGGDSNNHPELISSNDIYIKEDSLLNYQAIADDIDGDLITYYFDEYPKWLILGESIISGIPREGVMDTSFVVFASDGKSSDRLLVNVNVLPVNDSPNIISQSGFYAFEDSLFRYTVKATDPEDSTITYSFMDYPDWLYPVDSIIFGTPSNTSQDTSFLALASDGEITDSLLVTIEIIYKNYNPQIINIKEITFLNTETVQIDLDTCVIDDNHDTADLNWTVTSSNSNLNVVLENHIASFTAVNWTGQSYVDFIAINPHGGNDSIQISVNVLPSTASAKKEVSCDVLEGVPKIIESTG